LIVALLRSDPWNRTQKAIILISRHDKKIAAATTHYEHRRLIAALMPTYVPSQVRRKCDVSEE
jgi:hypothetical protein